MTASLTTRERAQALLMYLGRECPQSPLDMGISHKASVRRVLISALLQVEGDSAFGLLLDAMNKADCTYRVNMTDGDVEDAEEAAYSLPELAEGLKDECLGSLRYSEAAE